MGDKRCDTGQGTTRDKRQVPVPSLIFLRQQPVDHKSIRHIGGAFSNRLVTIGYKADNWVIEG
jgi:hypothetical protein